MSELSENDGVTDDNHVISLPIMTGDCSVFKFLWHRVDGKHLIRFQSKNTVLKFLWPSVDEV